MISTYYEVLYYVKNILASTYLHVITINTIEFY
jgi:hypothetical protein